MSELTFLPWTRAGAAAALNATSVRAAVNRPHLDVGLRVSSTPYGNAAEHRTASVWLRMLGPGDVTGLDPGKVIRTEPADGSSGVETTIFPAVELDEPSLPWLFSPTVEDAEHRLRPWLCLIVVRDQPGVMLDAAARRLTIGPPANPGAELPSLAEAFAWAHVQYSGKFKANATPEDIALALAGDPAASLSRLVSPRRLRENTRYLACVVPTWNVGVLAGLGGSPQADAPLEDAWDFGSADPPAYLRLPVYYSFTFTTGQSGDFLSLAQALVHPPDVSEGALAA